MARSEPRMESEDRYRVPSQHTRCAPGKTCHNPPVTDILRGTYKSRWYGLCADHLRDLNREVRDGRVWWLGFDDEDGAS